MTSLLDRKSEQLSGTSARGAMRPQHNYQPIIISKIFSTFPITATSAGTFDRNFLPALEITTSGLTLSSTSSTETTRIAINQQGSKETIDA